MTTDGQPRHQGNLGRVPPWWAREHLSSDHQTANIVTNTVRSPQERPPNGAAVKSESKIVLICPNSPLGPLPP